MSLKKLLRAMEASINKKRKKKRGFKDGPPVDKMMSSNNERTYVITK